MLKFIFCLIITGLVNLYAGNYSIIETTFKNKENIIDNDTSTFSTSGDLRHSEQFITLNLKEKKYIKNITIIWDKKNAPKTYKILGSVDYLNWTVIKNKIKASKFKQKNNTYINKINTDNKIAQFIKILISQDISLKKNKKYIAKISDIKFNYAKFLKPNILKISYQRLKKNSITIVWNTDHEALGQVRYGLAPNKIIDIHTEYFFTKKHSVKLKNLKKGTKYYFQIINQIPGGKHYTSKLLSFKTKGVPLPLIDSIKLKEKTHNSVKIKLIPNVKCSVSIKYGKNPGKLDKSLSIKYRKKSHIINIKGLIPLQTYFSKITITDNKKNTYKMEYKFKTGEYNIALKKKVYGTFKNTYIADIFRLKGNIIKRVTDGSYKYKTGMAVSYNPMQSDQFVTIDLGKSQKIEKVLTYWRALAYPYLYFIYYSNDNKKWVKFKGMTNLKNKKPSSVEGSGIPIITGETDINNITARYVKIFIPKGSPYYKKFKLYTFLQLMEVKIYGKYP